MLFGLGQGLGFIYWDMPKLMSFPFLGGRIKQDALTKNLCRNLSLNLDVKETSSIKTAWQNVKNKIDQDIPVGLKLDCYHLDYFTNKIHFAAHYVAIYGYDDAYVNLVDTKQQGSSVKATLKNLELARNEKGQMSSRNLSYSISTDGVDIGMNEILPVAIKRNATDFLNPPIKNVGYKGIEKTSQSILNWFARCSEKSEYELAASLMERGGTGGALFRNLFRDFLKESLIYIPSHELEIGCEMYTQIAPMWNEVSTLITKAGQTFDQQYLDESSRILSELSKRERAAMEILSGID
jgi:hypothetical protein